MLTPPAWLGVTMNVVAWAAWSVLVGWVAHRRPVTAFAVERRWSRLRSWERDGRWYERWWRIRAWKDRLPEAGDVFAGGYSKRSLWSRDPASLQRFVTETRRAEWAHRAAMALTPVFVLWNPPWALAVMVAYAVLANVPFIAIQRYNRARLLRVLARAERRAHAAAVRDHAA